MEFRGYQRQHNNYRHQRNHDSPECCLRLVVRECIDDGTNDKSGGKNVERVPGNAKGGSFKIIAYGILIVSNAYHHVGYSQTRQCFDEAINPEPEERKCFVLITKVG